MNIGDIARQLAEAEQSGAPVPLRLLQAAVTACTAKAPKARRVTRTAKPKRPPPEPAHIRELRKSIKAIAGTVARFEREGNEPLAKAYGAHLQLLHDRLANALAAPSVQP